MSDFAHSRLREKEMIWLLVQTLEGVMGHGSSLLVYLLL